MNKRFTDTAIPSTSMVSPFRRAVISMAVLLAIGGGQALADDEQATQWPVLDGSGYDVTDQDAASDSDEAAGVWDELLQGSGYENGSVQMVTVGGDGPSQASASYEDLLANADSSVAAGSGTDVLAGSGYVVPSTEVAASGEGDGPTAASSSYEDVIAGQSSDLVTAPGQSGYV